MCEFKMSKKLKEDSESWFSEVYLKDGLAINILPNWSDERILCFWVIKFIDNNIKYCRISMTEAKYIGEPDENLILSKEDVNELIKVLTTNYTGTLRWNDDMKFKRNWDYMITQLNTDHEYTYPNENLKWVNISKDLPIPDYTLLPTID